MMFLLLLSFGVLCCLLFVLCDATLVDCFTSVFFLAVRRARCEALSALFQGGRILRWNSTHDAPISKMTCNYHIVRQNNALDHGPTLCMRVSSPAAGHLMVDEAEATKQIMRLLA